MSHNPEDLREPYVPPSSPTDPYITVNSLGMEGDIAEVALTLLQDSVRHYYRYGYQPIGGISTTIVGDEILYIQAMVRPYLPKE